MLRYIQNQLQTVVFEGISVYLSEASEPDSAVIFAEAAELLRPVALWDGYGFEAVAADRSPYEAAAGQDPESLLSVYEYLKYPLIAEQRIPYLVQRMAVKTVQAILCADPDVTVIYFADAVDCRGKSFLV